MRAISINLGVKYSTVNMKQIQSSRSSICSTCLRGAHLERMLLLYTWTTFPEKGIQIALFDFEKYELTSKVAILLFSQNLLQKQTLTVHFQHTHPKNWFLPSKGLEPTSPWLLVGHAKPLHHQGYHAGNNLAARGSLGPNFSSLESVLQCKNAR